MSVDVLYRKRGSEIGLLTHGSLTCLVEIIVVVRKRFTSSDRVAATGEIVVASIDPLDSLLVDIATFFIGRRDTPPLADEPNATLETEDFSPSFANEGYLRRGLYYGFIPLQFRLKESV